MENNDQRGGHINWKEALEEKYAKKRYTENINKLFDEKYPQVRFSLSTTNETVLALHNKLFKGINVGEEKYKNSGEDRNSRRRTYK